MGLLRRLEALERRLGTREPRCEACGGPGGVGVVLLEEGDELGECEECGAATWEGRTVGRFTTVVVLHAKTETGSQPGW
jgi:hypothetical protein